MIFAQRSPNYPSQSYRLVIKSAKYHIECKTDGKWKRRLSFSMPITLNEVARLQRSYDLTSEAVTILTRPRSISKVSVKSAEKAIMAGFEDLGRSLKEQAVKAVAKLGTQHPDKTVGFCSSMGVWDFYIIKNGVRTKVRPPAARTFQHIDDTFGFTALPVVRITMKNGKMQIQDRW